MRIILILVGILFVNSVVAEPKRLVCENTAASVSYPARCEEFAEFGFRNTYTFDTRGLSNSQFSKTEVSRVSCGGYNSGVVASKLSASPSVITFSTSSWYENLGAFNIDRKTLEAGYDTERDYKCKLEDVDTSENLI
tara:strand:- start:86 stop:496 length:411 start_codon:yes stop_codon:yes gene_type:complete